MRLPFWDAPLGTTTLTRQRDRSRHSFLVEPKDDTAYAAFLVDKLYVLCPLHDSGENLFTGN